MPQKRISDLTPPIIEQSLTSNSTTSVPSIALVKAIAAGMPASKKAQLIIDGDSLDRGYTSSNETTKNWGTQLYGFLDQSKFGNPIITAVTGQTTQQMLDRMDQYVLGQIDTVNYQQAIISIGGGTNDGNRGVSYTQIKANKISYIQRVRAWQASHNNFPITVIMQTLTACGAYSGGNTSLADYEVIRLQHNADVENSYLSIFKADYATNLAADTRLSDPTNTVYYTDKLHQTDAGQLARAEDNILVFRAAQVGSLVYPRQSIQGTTVGAGSGSAAVWSAPTTGASTEYDANPNSSGTKWVKTGTWTDYSSTTTWADGHGVYSTVSGATITSPTLETKSVNVLTAYNTSGGNVLLELVRNSDNVVLDSKTVNMAGTQGIGPTYTLTATAVGIYYFRMTNKGSGESYLSGITISR